MGSARGTTGNARRTSVVTGSARRTSTGVNDGALRLDASPSKAAMSGGSASKTPNSNHPVPLPRGALCAGCLAGPAITGGGGETGGGGLKLTSGTSGRGGGASVGISLKRYVGGGGISSSSVRTSAGNWQSKDFSPGARRR
jgi:hypothetical protein